MILAQNRLLDILTPKETKTILDWTEENIFIPFHYQSPYKGKYSFDGFPIFREILNEIENPKTKEIVILKSSQLGFSQNILIPVALYNLSLGFPVIFATGLQQQAESFLIERIKPLIENSPAFEHMKIRYHEQEIYLENGGLLTCVHSSSKTGQKSRPAKIVCCDELDVYGFSVLEKLKSRTTHYYNSKIIVGSAPDSDSKTIQIGQKFLSPIFAEYEESSQAKYFLTHNNETFPLEFGFRKGRNELPSFGVKWNQDAKRKDGSYDENRIAETVHYKTPDGQTLNDYQKNKLLDSGHWQHTYDNRTKKGYSANGLYIKSKSMADLAIGYLRAKRFGGLHFKTWLLENFAEHLETEKIELSDRTLLNIVGDFKRGQNVFTQDYKTIMAVDVQKYGLWYLIADISLTEDKINVREWNTCQTFEEINGIANEARCNNVCVDIGYVDRRAEVYEKSMQYKFIPIMGRPRSNFANLYDVSKVDIYSGKKNQGNAKNLISQIFFQSETFKTTLFEIINGENHTKIALPKDYDGTLEKHLTSEVMENGRFIEKHKENHLLDCLQYILLIAKFNRFLPV
jgi:predicted house-cleaning noncanonical NTP pyrophosphatase (MazG superfamily)